MVSPKPISLTQVDAEDYDGAFEPQPLVVVGSIPGGGGGGSTAWSDITGKPTTFTPSAHTQDISTITGLQSALDLKASDSELAVVSGLASEAITLAGEASTDADAALSGLTFKANTADVVPITRTVAGKGLSADITLAKADVGLGNVDNTADSAKPVSTAQATAIALKANTASPTFTGTVGGITKAMVGLGSVDNTADSAKPVSTAQAAAIAAKVGSPNSTITGVAYYPTVASLPATGTTGVIYYVDAV